jgi:hypothetical protein
VRRASICLARTSRGLLCWFRLLLLHSRWFDEVAPGPEGLSLNGSGMGFDAYGRYEFDKLGD